MCINTHSHTHTLFTGYCFPTILRWLNTHWKSPLLVLFFTGKSDIHFSIIILAIQLVWVGLNHFNSTLWPSYLGTSESPPLNVVGSSSNMEEMSFPSGTDTRVYMTLSWTFLKRARKASCSVSSWREKVKTSVIQKPHIKAQFQQRVCITINESQVF